MRSSRPDSEQKQNSLFLENRELKSYLSNRKQLDFALKLALGSEAYLHDISSINDDSNASFSSIGNQMSPIKPVEKSQYKAKQSRFKEKQNIKQSHNMKQIEKSILSTTSQQRNMRQRLHSLQLWISFVKQRMKFSGQAQSPHKVSSSVNGGPLTAQQVNMFFKDVIYRLQKLQAIEKEEYNCKFLLCQLTQASIRENQYENKIEMLENQIKEKDTEIASLKQIIENLGRSKSRKGSGSPNRYGTQSLLGYSITDEESKMQYDDRTLKMSLGTASPSQKKRLFESVNLIQKNIEDTGEKMTTNAKTIQSDEKNSNVLKCKLFLQTNKKDQDESFLLNELLIKEVLNQNPVVINKNQKPQHYEASHSSDQIQEQKDDSSYKISESEIIEIKNEMEKLIAEKDELIEKLKIMSVQIAQLKANQGKDSACGNKKESMLYEMLSDGQQQVQDQLLTEKQNEQEQPYQSRFYHTGEHQFMAKDNQIISQRLSFVSKTIFVNQNFKSPYLTKSCISCHQLQSQIKSLQNHMTLIVSENQSLRQQLEQLQKYYHESQHQKLKLMQQICQIQAKSQQNETKVSNFLNEENPNNVVEKIDKVKEDEVEESESNLLSFCQATDQPNNNEANINNQDLADENTTAPQKSLKFLFSSLPQQLKQIFITLLQTNQRLRSKLKSKISELNKIKFILKQAKQINDEDMNNLQWAIQNGNQKRSKQIQKLKQIEKQWKISNEQSKKKQLTEIQQKNKELKLKVNNKMFKFIKHDKRKNSRNQRNSFQAI